MGNKLALGFALLVGLVWAGSPDAKANLIQGGNFESPVISGQFQYFTSIPHWTLTSRSRNPALIRTEFVTAIEGDQFIEIEDTDIAQSVATVAGQSYRVSWYASGDHINSSVVNGFARVQDVGSGTSLYFDSSALLFDLSQNTLADPRWDLRSFTFTAIGSQSVLSFGTSNTLGAPFLDQITMTLADTVPVQGAALSLGMALLLLPRNRRSR